MNHGHDDRAKRTMVTAWSMVAAMVLYAQPGSSQEQVLTPLTGVEELLTPLVGIPGNINAPDLNGDGKADIVAAMFGTDWLSIRLNNGDGTFGPFRRYRVGLKPSFIAVGDLNGDGKLDIAVSNAGSADVSILLGNGDGTMQAAKNYPISEALKGPLPTSNGTFSLVVDDFDHDGKLDVVTANSISNDVSFLRGNGDGTFQAAKTYPIAGPNSVGVIPFALSSADFDGDGNLDLVSGGVVSVTILKGDGKGGFTAIGSNLVGFDIACTNVADLDGDGILDIAATGTGTLNVKILLGNGDGTFRDGDNLSSLGFGPQCFSIADLNADGMPDIAVVNSGSVYGSGDLAILLGSGGGHFAGSLATTTYAVNFLPWATAVRDFDGDGKADVAAVNTFPPSVSVLRGNGDGTFQPQVVYPM